MKSARPSEANSSSSDRTERIARRAFQRHQERGGEHGHDTEDWFEAERELRDRERSGV